MMVSPDELEARWEALEAEMREVRDDEEINVWLVEESVEGDALLDRGDLDGCAAWVASLTERLRAWRFAAKGHA